MKAFYIILLIFLSNITLKGQDIENTDDPKIQLITKHNGDNIVLRWAPTETKWWFYGINTGYSIARRDMSDPNFQYEIIVDTLLPWSPEQMEAWYTEHPEDEAIVLPLQTIHRDWENTNYQSNNLADIFERSTYFDQRFETTILTADVYPIVAEAAGLKFIDENIDPNKQYSYRVRFNYGGYHQAYSVVQKWEIIDRPVLHEVIEKENNVTIKWERDLHGKVYTAYYIERSKNNSDFERLNKHPFVHGVADDIPDQKYFIYTDEVENYDFYYYRIIGINAFGELSIPSEAIPAQGRDRTPPVVKAPGSLRMSDSDDNEILWDHDPIDEIQQVILYKKDFKETSVVYNSNDSKNFSKRIVDDSVIDGMTDYYLVLVDTAGNVGQSARSSLYRKDEIPPSPPINLSAEVDTFGRVILKWDQGPDLDIIAYYVYSADRKQDNFIKLNQKKHLYRIYQDSINMTLLTPKRFYKVAAMDAGGNIGAYSDILEVNLPDKIPPSPCLFHNYQVDSAGIFLGLLPSSSRDVVEHRLYRKLAESSEWEIIQTFSKNPPQVFLDDKIESNKQYIYRWIAVDDADLESSPDNSTLHLTSYDIRNSFRPELLLQKDEAGIQIKIAQNIPGQDYRIQIIRSYKGSQYRTLKILSDEFEYLDAISLNSDEDLNVEYKAKILYKDGKRSKFSRAIKL